MVDDRSRFQSLTRGRNVQMLITLKTPNESCPLLSYAMQSTPRTRAFVLPFLPIVLLWAGTDPQPHRHPNLIIPGTSVGPLQLGDSRSRAEALFPPRKNMDQVWDASDVRCGTTYLWVDLRTKGGGNVFVHLKDNEVFQIDSATPVYRTAAGVRWGATPVQVRKSYPEGLRAFVLSHGSSEAEGERPLIYWVNLHDGIAFAFAYSRSEKAWYLDHTIVFKPGSEICPEPEPLDSGDQKKELPPYSLNPDAPAR